MSTISSAHRAFSQDNAKNAQREELAHSFVATQAFSRCLCPKHQYIFGTRGSGKTAIARMISHDHLSLFPDQLYSNVINEAEFIGVYVNTSLGFVSSIRSRSWKTDEEIEDDFSWRLNVSSCIALTHALESCIRSYVAVEDRPYSEANISATLCALWLPGPTLTSLLAIRDYLERLVLKRDQALARKRYTKGTPSEHLEQPIPGPEFGVELFQPFCVAANSIAPYLLPRKGETAWVICIDEAEFLLTQHRKMLNTVIRTRVPNVFIKIVTLPYEYTLETNIAGCNLDTGNDVDFVFLDEASSSTDDTTVISDIGKRLFNKRMSQYNPQLNIDLGSVLGTSEILDSKDQADAWQPGSRLWKLLDKHCNLKVRRRAQMLAGTPEFLDQIGRKLSGVLPLIEILKSTGGNARIGIYSGYSMFLRCCDGNPRRLIRLYKEILIALQGTTRQQVGQVAIRDSISPVEQNDILRRVGQSLLDRVISEPETGPAMDKLLKGIGTFINHLLTKQEVSTDIISAVSLDDKDHDLWRAAKKLISIGYLYTQASHNIPTQMPEGTIVLRLAFIFSPIFRTMPRKGRHKSWSSASNPISTPSVSNLDSSNESQLTIWTKP